MMSTALVMAVGGEQLKTRSAASDRVESGEMTFAQSFGERVGLAVDVPTMKSTGDASSEMPGGKSSGSLNSDVPVASTGVKANAVADQRMAMLDETTGMAMNVASGKDESLPVDFVARANVSHPGQSKTTPGQLPADGEVQRNTGAEATAQASVSQTKAQGAAAATGNNAHPVGDVERIATSPVVSNDVLVAESSTVDSVPRESTAIAERSLLSRDAVEPTILNETVPAGKTLDVTAAKKSARAQESTVGAKPTPKTGGTIESEKVVGDAANVTGVQGATPLPIQTSAPADARPDRPGVTAANAYGVVGTIQGKPAVGLPTTGTENTGRKAIVRTGNDEVESAGRGADPTTGMAVATGFGEEIAKAAAVASAPAKDADEKGMGAAGAATLFHAVGGSEGTASGIVSGTASGHIPTEVSGAKTQAADAGVHAATVQTGLGEQDASGSAVAEMGMSHRTLLATPTALEVGLASGTQGWLKIRAEMTDGGVVTASLSSATSAGQEMLHRELPALTAYLQEERVAVNTVVVPANAAAGTEPRFTGGMNGEGSGQAQQGSHHGGGDTRQELISGTSDRADEIPTYMGLNGVGDDGLLSGGTYAGGGSWLNVRA